MKTEKVCKLNETTLLTYKYKIVSQFYFHTLLTYKVKSYGSNDFLTCFTIKSSCVRERVHSFQSTLSGKFKTGPPHKTSRPNCSGKSCLQRVYRVVAGNSTVKYGQPEGITWSKRL